MSSPSAKSCRMSPHRRYKPGYKSPATIKHSLARLKKHILLLDNLETLNEFYGMDTPGEKFAIQNYFFKFDGFREGGETIWVERPLNRKCIVWKNTANGFTVAKMKDIEYEIRLPNFLPTYEENFSAFQALWVGIEYNIKLLFENIRSHKIEDEYCCLDCHFPFLPICSELYSQFEPDPPPSP